MDNQSNFSSIVQVDDDVPDVYTIMAIAFLALLGLTLLVRLCASVVSCGVALEEAVESKPTVKIEGVQQCAAP